MSYFGHGISIYQKYGHWTCLSCSLRSLAAFVYRILLTWHMVDWSNSPHGNWCCQSAHSSLYLCGSHLSVDEEIDKWLIRCKVPYIIEDIVDFVVTKRNLATLCRWFDSGRRADLFSSSIYLFLLLLPLTGGTHMGKRVVRWLNDTNCHMDYLTRQPYAK